jgi:hypothetical protein
MSSTPRESRNYLGPAFDLLLDDPLHVRKGCAHSPQNIFQSLDTWPLARQRHFFDHVGTEVITGGIDITIVQYSLDELTNDFGLVFHTRCQYVERISSPMAAHRERSSCQLTPLGRHSAQRLVRQRSEAGPIKVRHSARERGPA